MISMDYDDESDCWFFIKTVFIIAWVAGVIVSIITSVQVS